MVKTAYPFFITICVAGGSGEMEFKMKKEVFLFGASFAGEKAFDLLKDKYYIVGFIDNDSQKWGSKKKGKEVFPPQILKSYDKKIKIIIASMYYKDIIKQLRGMGYSNYSNFYLKDVYGFYNSTYLDYIKLICYPFTLFLSTPIILLQALWNSIVLFNGNWGDYSQFSARTGLGYLWYRTTAINIYTYGRNGITQLFGVKDYQLSKLFYYSLPSFYTYWITGPVSVLIGMFGWLGMHFIWLRHTEPIWALIVLGLVLISSTFYANTFFLQNYNAIGWVFFPLGLYGLLNNNWLLATGAWVMAGFGSITALFIGGIISFVVSLLLRNISPLITLIPASLIILTRFIPIISGQKFKNTFYIIGKAIGVFKGNVKYKRKSAKYLSSKQVIYLILCIQFLIVISLVTHSFPVLFFTGIGIYIVNSLVARFADEQTMYITILSLATIEVIQTSDIRILISFWLLISPLPAILQIPSKKIYRFAHVPKPFFIKPLVDDTKRFLSEVSKGDKIFMAFNNPHDIYERLFDGYRYLLELPFYVATQKGVGLLPNWFAVFEYNYQGAPEFWGRDVESVRKNLEYWKAEYVIIYQKPDDTLNKEWEKNGFKLLSTFNWNDYKEYLDETLLGLTENLTWFLLHYPLNNH